MDIPLWSGYPFNAFVCRQMARLACTPVVWGLPMNIIVTGGRQWQRRQCLKNTQHNSIFRNTQLEGSADYIELVYRGQERLVFILGCKNKGYPEETQSGQSAHAWEEQLRAPADWITRYTHAYQDSFYLRKWISHFGPGTRSMHSSLEATDPMRPGPRWIAEGSAD